MPELDDRRLLRYSRQILLPEIGVEGQRKLFDSTVLIVGLGGLGSPLAMYLVAAGVGRLLLADDDEVELSNLQRQILHREADLGDSKAESAERVLRALNSEVEIISTPERMDGDALRECVKQADVVADASDNFETRYAVNLACRRGRRPLVSAAVVRMEGQVAAFSQQPGSACYQCLFPPGAAADENCTRAGIMGPVAGIAGSMQAMETIKLLLGVGRSLSGRLFVFDALNMEWRDIRLRRDKNCAVCGAEAGIADD